MRIRDLATHNGQAGAERAWSSSRENRNRRCVRHHTTLMLAFVTNDDGVWDHDTDTVFVSTGNGSASDQLGMNQLFHALNMPFYFARRNGSRIVNLDTQEQVA